MAFFFGPRQTTDSRDDERRKPIDMQARRPPVCVSREDEKAGAGAEEVEGTGGASCCERRAAGSVWAHET